MAFPDPSFLAVAAPAVVFAGISKGGFGSGAAFASAAILALVVEPKVAIGLMLPLLMLIDLATLRPYWRRWNRREAWLLILGSLPGIALGALFYRVANADHLRLLIGAIALLFVAWQVLGRAGKIPAARRAAPDWGGVLAGVAVGFTSFVAHAGGPAAAVYLLSKHPTKTGFQATSVLVFWVNNMLKAIPYGMLGMFTWDTLTMGLWLAPFALLGTWLGVKAHFAISERAFFALTYVLLTVTGTKLVWDGLT
jgi:uncharacterized membrane protein YfcA